MSDTPMTDGAGDLRSRALVRPTPTFAFAATLAVLAAILALNLVPTLPIGAMYWDLVIYLDGAQRVLGGQVPSVDFFAPVGPLGYWLFAGALALFPKAQPLLLADWSLLAVTAPPMALVVHDVGRRSPGLAFALLLPFLFFSILPFNVEVFSSYPGVDGFGIYNRQGCRILYLLACGLCFSTSGWRLCVVVAGAMLALFLTKITGFVAGGLLCAFALVAGRLSLRVSALAALLFLACLAVLEAAFGVVGAYLGDIETLVGMNEETLAPRFLQAASVHFNVFGPLLLLISALLALQARDHLGRARRLIRRPGAARLASLLDRDVFWIAAAALAALFYETQNTGSQAFVFLWPMLLRLGQALSEWRGWRRGLVGALAAAAALPTPVDMGARALRTAIGQVKYERLDNVNLGTLGAVTQRSEFLGRAEAMAEVYAGFPGVFGRLATDGQLPSVDLYSQPDYQLTFLKAVDEAVSAIRLYEAAHSVRFETVMNLGFVNPFPWLLDRQAPRFIAIGATPGRTVPKPGEPVARSVRGADLVVKGKCPVTTADDTLLSIYEPFLDGHRRISLSRCWDAFVQADLRAR